jgi:hypothetical protein
MNTRPTIKRRDLLLGAAGVTALALLRPLTSWLPALEERSALDGARLAGLLAHQESARVVGREYLRAVPAEAREDVLTAGIVNWLPAQHRGSRIPADSHLRELLLLGAREDFAEGRTVELHGWVVSVTEARLCALATLC